MNYKQVASVMGIVEDKLRDLIAGILEEEADKEKLEDLGRGKYVYAQQATKVIEGRIEITRNGRGFVIVEGQETDIPVSKGDTADALYGDTVEVAFSRTSHKPRAKVVRVVKRGRTQYVCVLQKQKNFAFALPTDAKIHIDFFIPPHQIKDAQDGEKIVVEIASWNQGEDSPVGRVVKVLGAQGDNDVEMHAIMIEYGLPYYFDEEVQEDAERIPKEITAKEVKSRRDMREILTFTIDPADAKDFDDALSLQKLENGNWELGVHIADVSHYLRPGTILDDEAYSRATSVYLVDRTIPMLPEVLSNELCSLRPNEDKLCFSAVFELDDDARVVKEWFGRTVIHSDRRYAYEDAQEVIEGIAAKPEDKGEKAIHAAVLTLDRLSKILRKKRFEKGGIDFNTEEVKFELAEDGKPIGVYIKVMKDANKLIEDFMLLANVKVAEFIGKSAKKKAPTFVYRIHDTPDLERLRSLRDFAARFGYDMPKPSKENAEFAIRELLKTVEGKAEEDVIKTMAIRTMAKAVYSTENIGHYGLSFDFYSHFTSPIRRYPDVMVHRLLQHYLDGGESVEADIYEKKCKHSSEQEKKASEAERASIKYKQVEFMLSRVGEQFDGVITGITSWGIYVEINETKCEGMVPLDSMKDDHYHFNEDLKCLVGQRSKKEYHFGNDVKVIVDGANLLKRQLDFSMA
jgi:ribonuclease R